MIRMLFVFGSCLVSSACVLVEYVFSPHYLNKSLSSDVSPSAPPLLLSLFSFFFGILGIVINNWVEKIRMVECSFVHVHCTFGTSF